MKSDLVAAIDAAVAYVKAEAHLDPWTEADVEDFAVIADRVYMLAHAAGLLECLPQQLTSELDCVNPAQRPITFETKLNMPGDWELTRDSHKRIYGERGLPISYPLLGDEPQPPIYHFITHVPQRWYDDMAMLRLLASSHDNSAKSNPFEALLDGEAREILEIARSSKSSSDKAIAICKVDRRYLAWDSPKWGKLLGVTHVAICKGYFWKVWREEQLAKDRDE